MGVHVLSKWILFFLVLTFKIADAKNAAFQTEVFLKIRILLERSSFLKDITQTLSEGGENLKLLMKMII